MDNLIMLLLGSGLTAGGAVSFRGSKMVGIRALAAAAFAPGAIMLFVAVVNVMSLSSG